MQRGLKVATNKLEGPTTCLTFFEFADRLAGWDNQCTSLQAAKLRKVKIHDWGMANAPRLCEAPPALSDWYAAPRNFSGERRLSVSASAD